ncbi:MAG: TIGR03086 family metal-binding protein [Jatrophihabitans sp.]|uniref:TIGR03086 family metal-binding protein n=1 Tax=Jatrophihabitans sp. TaxID=1932789 RepID=UPI00390EB783
MPINTMTVPLDLHRRAVQATLAALDGRVDLSARTPCAGWDLADLLAHMTVQQCGFARAVTGARTAVADWAPTRAEKPVEAYASACDELLTAFAAVEDPAAPVHLPEIHDEPVPAQLAVGFQLVDNVVHAWDVAVSLGRRPEVDDDVVAAALVVARQVPDGGERDRPGAAFAHALPIGAGRSALDETLLLLGRDPTWRAG